MSKYNIIVKTLLDTYPDAKCELEYKTPYELLVATVLSAQSTDVRVNIVTKELFKIHTDTDNEGIGFGYGIWIEHKNYEVKKYFLQGYDPGVNFRMVYYLETDVLVLALSNEDTGTKEACEAIEKTLIEEFQSV